MGGLLDHAQARSVAGEDEAGAWFEEHVSRVTAIGHVLPLASQVPGAQSVYGPEWLAKQRSGVGAVPH